MGQVESQPLQSGPESLNKRDVPPPQRVRKHATSSSEPNDNASTYSRSSLAGRAARAPLSWAVSGAELFASTTADVAVSTMNAALKTASVLASTTEAVGNVVASTTSNVALTSATVATQTATLITAATSVGAKTAGDTIAGAATLVVEGISNTGHGHATSPKHVVRDSRARSRSADSASAVLQTKQLFATNVNNQKSQDLILPEAMGLGANSNPENLVNDVEYKQSFRRVNVGSRLLCLLGATNISARKQWVATVTNSKPSPPSAKYLKKILTLAWETKGQSVDEFYRFLQSRPITTSPNCALKALITSLRIVREGPPEALQASIVNVGLIDAMGASWAEKVLVEAEPPMVENSEKRSTSPNDFGKTDLHEQMLIARLSGFIVQKMHFHSKQSDLNSRYEITTLSSTSDEEDVWEKHVQISSSLLTLLGTIEGVARLALGMGGGNEKTAPPTPAALSLSTLLIEEALSAFDALSSALANTKTSPDQDANLNKSLMNRYHEAYKSIRVYCSAALKFPYVVALNKVPTLNDEVSPLGSSRLSISVSSPVHATSSSNFFFGNRESSTHTISLLARPFTRGSMIQTLEEEEALENRLGSVNSADELLPQASPTIDDGIITGSQKDLSPKSTDSSPANEPSASNITLYNPWEFSSNSVDHARPPPDFCLETEDEDMVEPEDDNFDGGDEESKVRTQTFGNPFDTGNSTIILLAAAHRSAFSTITNPFASGQFNAFATNQQLASKLLHQNSNALISKNKQEDATKRALEQCVRLFEFSGINMNPDNIIMSKEMIGRGAFSIVYKGILRDSNEEVAVKELSIEEWGRPEVILDFRAEVALMKAVHHPNVLQLIGACTSPNLRLVSEFCHRGNLFDLLYNDRAASPGSTSKVLNWPLRLKLALGEARGMHFLHTAFPAPLIHRDLKSLNLLLSKNWTLKVSDFGLSRFRRRGVNDGPCGTTQWMAPEVIQGKDYDESADVYSFGINLWELASRRVPWEGEPDVKRVVIEGKRLSLNVLDMNCPQQYVELIQKCWSVNPEERPTFNEIVGELKAMSKLL